MGLWGLKGDLWVWGGLETDIMGGVDVLLMVGEEEGAEMEGGGGGASR